MLGSLAAAIGPTTNESRIRCLVYICFGCYRRVCVGHGFFVFKVATWRSKSDVYGASYVNYCDSQHVPFRQLCGGGDALDCTDLPRVGGKREREQENNDNSVGNNLHAPHSVESFLAHWTSTL